MAEYAKRKKTWSERFKELKAFKKKHGHCLVPLQGTHESSLGSWVSYQRGEYRRFKESGSACSSMTKTRIKLLEQLGFVWVARV